MDTMSKTIDDQERKNQILASVYESSWGISVLTLAVIGGLELFMLAYTFINPELYQIFIGRYRAFYISLLTVAVAFILLYLYAKNDIDHRYKILNVANPFGAIFFFAWALGITFSDLTVTGAVDSTVFMTFSLMIPLSFYLLPGAYLTIALVSDAIMLYLIMLSGGVIGQFINISIFFVFQVILGISFLRLKINLADRMLEERINAITDVLTGFSNRRAYEQELLRLKQHPLKDDFTYIAIDINGLKETNDAHGHEAGDTLIVAVARCIEQSFGDEAQLYRIGGDEFAVLLPTGKGNCEELLSAYQKSMKAWSERSSLTLSTATGCVCADEYPGCDVTDLARAADRKMYAEKARYYQQGGMDRRRRSIEALENEEANLR